MSGSARRLRVRKACEGSLGFRRRRPHPLEGAVDGEAYDAEEFSEFGLGVGAEVVQLEQMLGLIRLQLRLLPAQPAVGFGDLHPSRVRIRIGSVSNSATTVSTSNSSRPTGSVGSWIEPPRLSFTLRFVNSSKMSRASGSDRASRSSFVTTSVSPA